MKKATVAESAAVYGTMLHDLEQPLILQQEGHPLAVLVSFDDYQRLQALTADEAQRREVGWLALDTLLKEIHARASDQTAEEIEAEIGIARDEVRQSRAG
jgi:PHD/YefM family antitoxin component YafN of YafNO toxin-antitoxin module